MTTNEQMVDYLIERGVLSTPEIIDAFRSVDRKDFVPESLSYKAYDDNPLPIGFGSTISQPFTVAFMLELLKPGTGYKVLDVGSGSGWTSALLAHITGDEGMVYGVEIVPELVLRSQKSISKYGFSNVKIMLAKKGVLGLPDLSPFDRILVSASARSIPEELIEQLSVGGRIVIPVGESILSIDKVSESSIKKEEYYGFRFVPLQ